MNPEKLHILHPLKRDHRGEPGTVLTRKQHGNNKQTRHIRKIWEPLKEPGHYREQLHRGQVDESTGERPQEPAQDAPQLKITGFTIVYDDLYP